jgi:hypothetical protein
LAKVNNDERRALARHYGIRSLPMALLMRHGRSSTALSGYCRRGDPPVARTPHRTGARDEPWGKARARDERSEYGANIAAETIYTGRIGNNGCRQRKVRGLPSHILSTATHLNCWKHPAARTGQSPA